MARGLFRHPPNVAQQIKPPVVTASGPAPCYFDAVTADTPSQWWRLGETSGTTAFAVVGTNGTYTGTNYTLGQPGSLSGDTDLSVLVSGTLTQGSVIVAGSIVPAGVSAQSYEFWFKRNGRLATSFDMLLSTGTGTLNVYFDASNFLWVDDDNNQAVRSGAISDTNWHYVVVTKAAGTATVPKIYIDTVDVSVAGTTPLFNGPATGLTIGDYYNRAALVAPGAAYIDEVAIYGYELTAGQIAAHFAASTVSCGTQTVSGSFSANAVLKRTQAASFTANAVLQKTSRPYNAQVVADAPAAYWRLGETTGTSARDQIGSNVGTYIAAPTLGASGALVRDANTAVTFNGSTQWVTVADNNALDVGNIFSVEAWAYRPAAAAGTVGTIATKGSGSFSVEWADDERVYFQRVGSGQVALTTTTLSADTWHHIVVTKSGSSRHIYIDGVDLTSLDVDSTFTDNTEELVIGRRRLADGSGFPFNGKLDEIAVYNVALTADQVKEHYRLGTAGPGPVYVDGLLRKTQTGSTTASAVLKRTQTGSLTADAALFRSATGSFTAAAVIKRTQTGSLTASAILLKTQTSSLTANAALKRTLTGTFTADALLKRTQTGSLTADAAIVVSATTVTGSFPADAALLATRSAALTASAIQRKTYQPYSSLVRADGAIGYWRFGDRSSPAVDEIGSNNGVASGPDVVFGQTGALAVDPDKAVAFVSTTDRITVPANVALNTGDVLSIEYWAKRTRSGVGNEYVAVNIGFGEWYVSFSAGDYPSFGCNGQPDGFRTLVPVTDTNWHHIVFTKNGAVQHAYLDGVESTFVANVVTVNTFASDVWFGVNSFVGSLDEFSLYNYALTAAQVAEHYRLATTGPGLALADAAIVVTRTGSFSADATILRTQTGATTANAVLLRGQTGSTTASAVLIGSNTGSFTANGILKASRTSSTTAAAVLFRNQTGSTTANAVLTRPAAGSLTVNAIVGRTGTGSLTVNAVLKRTQTGSIAVNAAVFATRTGSLTASACIFKTATGSFSAAAALKVQATGSFTAAALIAKTTSSSITASAWLISHVAGSLTANAAIFKRTTASFAADAQLSGAGTGSIGVYAVIRGLQTATFTVNAVRGQTFTSSTTASALLLRTTTSSLTASAAIRSTRTGSTTVDAVLRIQRTGSFPASAAIGKTTTTGFPAAAQISVVGTSTLRLDAVLLRGRAASFSLDATIVATRTGSFRADAAIRRSATGGLTSDAWVYRTSQASLTTDATIRRVQTRTLAASAVVAGTASASIPAAAVLTRAGAGSFSLEALKKTVAQAGLSTDAVVLATRTVGFATQAALLSPRTGSLTLDAAVIISRPVHQFVDASFTAATVTGSFSAATVEAGVTAATVSWTPLLQYVFTMRGVVALEAVIA